jgi:hypothetical protein
MEERGLRVVGVEGKEAEYRQRINPRLQYVKRGITYAVKRDVIYQVKCDITYHAKRDVTHYVKCDNDRVIFCTSFTITHLSLCQSLLPQSNSTLHSLHHVIRYQQQ